MHKIYFDKSKRVFTRLIDEFLIYLSSSIVVVVVVAFDFDNFADDKLLFGFFAFCIEYNNNNNNKIADLSILNYFHE